MSARAAHTYAVADACLRCRHVPFLHTTTDQCLLGLKPFPDTWTCANVRISCTTEERLPDIPVQNITEYLRKKTAIERGADGKQSARKTGVGCASTHAHKYHVRVCSAARATMKHESDNDSVGAAPAASAPRRTNCDDDSDGDDEEQQPRSKKSKASAIPTRSSKRGKQDVVTPPPTSTVKKPKTVVSNCWL